MSQQWVNHNPYLSMAKKSFPFSFVKRLLKTLIYSYTDMESEDLSVTCEAQKMNVKECMMGPS